MFIVTFIRNKLHYELHGELIYRYRVLPRLPSKDAETRDQHSVFPVGLFVSLNGDKEAQMQSARLRFLGGKGRVAPWQNGPETNSRLRTRRMKGAY